VKGLPVKVLPVANDFFGHSVTVAGLLTGEDILKACQNFSEPGCRFLIPETALRHGTNILLDDMTIEELEGKLGLPVIPVSPDGESLIAALQREKE
jgi:NifB/MoaA-like Fe-S oxidoreductase